MNFAQRLTPALQNSSDEERRYCNRNLGESDERGESVASGEGHGVAHDFMRFYSFQG